MIKKKELTTNDLANLMQKGFANAEKDTNKKIAGLTSTIDSLAIMTKEGFDDVHGELKEINTRLDRIENILIAGHDRRIERLEDGMLQIKTALSLKTG